MLGEGIPASKGRRPAERTTQEDLGKHWEMQRRTKDQALQRICGITP